MFSFILFIILFCFHLCRFVINKYVYVYIVFHISAKTAATIRAKKIEENKMRWLAMRQNSMPVQIDSEVLRVIPKYMRKKIKSAEGEKKKKDRRRMLID